MTGGSTAREPRVWARIDHDALRANFAEAGARAPGATVFAVLKADAYGHEAAPVARSLLSAGCRQLAVFSLDEACALRDAGIGAPILLLGGVRPALGGVRDAAREAAARGLAVVIHDLGQLEALAAAAGPDAPVRVHVELDSGMHRLGAAPAEAAALVKAVLEAPGVELEGLMTHLARADEADLAASREQLARFAEFLARARRDGATPRFVHFANSAGLLAGTELAAACPEANAVRPGLVLYGARPAPHLPGALRPVMTLAARVDRVQALEPGDPVGYSALWRAERPTRVATVLLGYADGVPVAASNRGFVLIRGRRHPMVGRVSMDSLGVEVGDAPVEVGDEALVFGEALRVEEAAQAAGTIAYELLSRVGGRVPRVHVGV